MKSKRPVLLIPVFLIVLGLLAHFTALRAWTSFIGYHPPYSFSNPGAAALPPITSHVFIVLVDGLRYDQSREMNFLNELRRRGADVICRVGLPSLSLPGRAVMMSGAWQEIHGQLTNFNAHPLPVDTIFQLARKRGLKTALEAGNNPQKLFAPYIDERVPLPSGDGHNLEKDVVKGERELHQAAASARELIRTKDPKLFLIDFTVTDEVAHDFGAVSPQYKSAADLADNEIRNLATLIDFSNSVLIVTSDHGHVDRGGHGGDEPDVMTVPWVMAGKGIQPSVALLGRQVDLAPTVAALLGTQIPAANQGMILTDALQIDDAAKVRLLDSLYQQRENFTDAYLSVVKGTPAHAFTQEPSLRTVTSLEAALDGLDAEAQAAKQERISREPAARLKWVLPIVLLPLVCGLFYLRSRWIIPGEVAWGFGAIGIYWIVYGVLFEVAHMGYSFTAVNVEENLQAFFGKDMLFAIGALFIAVAVAAGLMRRRQTTEVRKEAGLSAGGTLSSVSYVAAAMIAFSILVKVCVEYWRFGLFVRWYIPNLHWGFGIYLDLLQLVIVGYVAWLAPLPAWVGVKIIPGSRRSLGR
ncbi:MAG: alkaline phosphatase family protein [Acidobacteriia bacterium]|nr:alkaline phosphatase family protein [Terriglobia bacterium]